ncbi:MULTISPECIES: hypothetical protein [unclassified Marinobacter]|uniref:hypothetical protein n=1 Tax=unclassified Marinobacter TaxID=83889 RepID=UPI0008DD06C2|nr:MULTISPECIES: hypothetical protein [unclassified Marinobacter]MBQ0832827.1 hypothetical protein [Marinobacter sp.]OHY72882.1 hypothetical protein BCA33_19095 [Marinobacter sp. AC-23]
MTLGWVVAGTIGQCLLAYMLFMLVVFGFSAVGTTHRPTPFDSSVLDSGMYSVPASCIVSAVIVIVLYRMGAGKLAYLWYTAPLFLFSGYLLYIRMFIEREANL